MSTTFGEMHDFCQPGLKTQGTPGLLSAIPFEEKSNGTKILTMTWLDL